MKRFIFLLLSVCLLLSFSGCSLLSDPTPPSVSVADPTAPTPSRVYETEEDTQEESSQNVEQTPNPLDELYVPGNSYAKVYRTQSGAIWAMIAMEFTNVSQNPLFFDYANIDLQGKGGEVFQTIETVSFLPQIIAPGETGYYCEVVALDVAEEIPLTPRLSKDFHGIYPVEDSVFYEISHHSLTDSLYGGVELQASVKNTSDVDGELVCISAIFRDENGEVVGFISDYLDGSLPAGKTAELTFESFMLPDDLTAAKVAEVEIYAYPLLDRP